MFQLPIRTLDSEHSTGSSELGQLPDWNLNDLYTATDAKELIRDLNWLEKECNEFAKSYEGKLHTLSDKEMLTCIVRNEKISSISGRIISYAGLLYYQAGVAVVTASIFQGLLGINAQVNAATEIADAVLTGSSINLNADGIRHRVENISFNNTTELNSTVYFCRVNNTDFNYSANPTYLSSSKMVVKTNSVSYTHLTLPTILLV